MSGRFRIFGSEMSPYSVKVRSYFRYKGIAHDWLVRGPANQAEYAKHAKLPLIPLVVVERAGHFLHLERPDEVNARIVSFLTGAPS